MKIIQELKNNNSELINKLNITEKSFLMNQKELDD